MHKSLMLPRHWLLHLAKGSFTLGDNDVFFFPSSFANSYIDNNATHLWRHGYNVKNLCRCRQVRTGPNWDNAGAEFRKNWCDLSANCPGVTDRRRTDGWTWGRKVTWLCHLSTAHERRAWIQVSRGQTDQRGKSRVRNNDPYVTPGEAPSVRF